MTVKELIKRLSELPPDAIAMVRDSEGEILEVDDADLMMIHWAGVKERVYITGNY